MYQNFNETMSIISAVTFDYHMYGSDMGTVLLQGSVDGSSYMTFWSRTGNAGNVWYRANVTVDQPAATGYYKWLRFHYTSGSNYEGDLALDNVAVETRVSTNSTPAPTTTPSPIRDEIPEPTLPRADELTSTIWVVATSLGALGLGFFRAIEGGYL